MTQARVWPSQSLLLEELRGRRISGHSQLIGGVETDAEFALDGGNQRDVIERIPARAVGPVESRYVVVGLELENGAEYVLKSI